MNIFSRSKGLNGISSFLLDPSKDKERDLLAMCALAAKVVYALCGIVSGITVLDELLQLARDSSSNVAKFIAAGVITVGCIEGYKICNNVEKLSKDNLANRTLAVRTSAAFIDTILNETVVTKPLLGTLATNLLDVGK